MSSLNNITENLKSGGKVIGQKSFDLANSMAGGMLDVSNVMGIAKTSITSSIAEELPGISMISGMLGDIVGSFSSPKELKTLESIERETSETSEFSRESFQKNDDIIDILSVHTDILSESLMNLKELKNSFEMPKELKTLESIENTLEKDIKLQEMIYKDTEFEDQFQEGQVIDLDSMEANRMGLQNKKGTGIPLFDSIFDLISGAAILMGSSGMLPKMLKSLKILGKGTLLGFIAVALVEPYLDAFKAAWQSAIDGNSWNEIFLDFWNALGKSTYEMLDESYDWIKNFNERAEKKKQMIDDKIKERNERLYEDFTSWLDDMGLKMKNISVKMTDWVVGLFVDSGEWLKDEFKNSKDAFIGGITDWLNSITQDFQNMLQGIKEFFTSKIDSILSSFEDAKDFLNPMKFFEKEEKPIVSDSIGVMGYRNTDMLENQFQRNEGRARNYNENLLIDSVMPLSLQYQQQTETERLINTNIINNSRNSTYINEVKTTRNPEPIL